MRRWSDVVPEGRMRLALSCGLATRPHIGGLRDASPCEAILAQLALPAHPMFCAPLAKAALGKTSKQPSASAADGVRC